MNFLRPSPEGPAPTQTAVIAPVPGAESLVGDYRQRLDASAVRGVPAHVTVLAPFLAPHEVDEQVIATLTAAVVSVPAFDCRFTQARSFGHDVRAAPMDSHISNASSNGRASRLRMRSTSMGLTPLAMQLSSYAELG